MMRQKRKKILTIAWLLLCAALSLVSVPPAVAASLVGRIVADPLTGVAIEGFDPVSYFTDVEPQQGLPEFTTEWGGVPWYFANAANRDVFVRNPEIYAPQFGGHCATSLARGYLSDGKPRLFLIRKLKLYFFYSVANREAFLASERALTSGAIKNWPGLETTLVGEEGRMVDALGDRNSEAPAEAAAHAPGEAH
jgi:YHS domain-containing protein